MRSPIILLGCVAILLASCSSTPSGDGGAEGVPPDDSPPPADVPDVTGQRVHVELRVLKPGRQDPPMGLINRSSPELKELYRQPKAYAHVKPIDDSLMGALLDAFREEDFYEYAEKGRTLDSLRVGEGHGAIWLQRGDESWALIFKPGQGGTPVPEIYVTLKNWIIGIHRRTLWLTPTITSNPDRVFRVEPHKHRLPGR